jgi:hypothetical protein
MPIKDAMNVIENIVGVILTARTSPKDLRPKMATDIGTAYKKEIFSVTITDKPAFENFAFANNFTLLEIRASESAIKAHIEKQVKLQSNLMVNERVPVLIPGIKTDRLDKVIFRAK